ncbi:MAG TPA: CheR family methyltransferase [Burkholderiaceae bacterium]|nr:CheR family methyltransferase [Burkholderiaceae bacterium]
MPPATEAAPASPAFAPDAAPNAAAATGATPFPVVGIGASAGGLAAFEDFFAAMPPEEGNHMAFVLVQHLSPDHKSLLADLVQRYTRMQVQEAHDGQPVLPGCTYIIPPNHNLSLVDGALHLSRHDEERRPHLTIDHFFSSLAAAQRERAIAIVMSGTGSDGTLGLREVKGEGGLVIVQAPDSTEHDGMPRSAIATGMVDYVLPPGEMPAQLIAYVRHAFDPARKPAPAPLRDGMLKKMCALLRAQTGHDFSQYKETTLVRRMERRMALRQIARSEEYLRFARENPQEVDALFRDLLIGVTNFFRDQEAFKVLEQKVIPGLLAHKTAHDALRVWICACSTGEEAYSIAILLHEHMMNARKVLKVQVFATDIDRQAIEQARSGVYPDSIAANVSEERLKRFFTHDTQRGTYRIQKHIRDLVVFSEQDVIKDPPFSKLDLVSCRNLLIYLNADLQRKLIPLFHYALVPGGALFLGTSETVGESARLFHVVDRKWKLYVRLPGDKGAARLALPDFVPLLADGLERRAPLAAAAAGAEPGSLRQVTEQALVAHYGQAGVLIDDRGQILHIVGRTGKFLEPADGDAAMNILAMARDGLRRELTIAVHKAVTHRQPVSYPGLNVKANGHYIKANLTVRPVDMPGSSPTYLVVLEEVQPRPADVSPSLAETDQAARIAALEQELRAKDEYLQTTLEEMETSNEELKSTNEEMQSINEELQSTNEELETSKEELQSVNEELSTVNAELQDKVTDLSRANNDMNNLLASTGVGTVFVDHQLRIARFTPAATQVINLIPGDIGRPLEHVASNLVGYDRMVEDISTVLETLAPKEAEVQIKSGAWYLMRIRPYRTMENLIEGAVITLVDINERKKAEQSLRRSEARLNVLINQAYAGVSETDLDGRILFANDRLCEMLGYSREELMRKRLGDLTDAEDLPRVQAQFQALAAGGQDIQVERRYVHSNGSRVRVHERVSAIRDGGGMPGTLLSLSFDPQEGGDNRGGVPGRA